MPFLQADHHYIKRHMFPVLVVHILMFYVIYEQNLANKLLIEELLRHFCLFRIYRL